MKPLGKFRGIAALLQEADIDTDQIIPARFMRRSRQEGFRDQCFYDRRYDTHGQPRHDFVLNDPAFAAARILVGGSNFGCGSSREHAVWALRDYGIDCVIAPGFGDIFYNNALQNGLLVIKLSTENISEIALCIINGRTNEISVNLPEENIDCCGIKYQFEIESYWKNLIMKGISEIEDTLRRYREITVFESTYRASHEWLFDENA